MNDALQMCYVDYLSTLVIFDNELYLLEGVRHILSQKEPKEG